MKPDDIAVLELSSFQLMTMTHSPHIAVITNLAPNHLDVHKSFQEYIDAKENIFTHQATKDIAVFNADNSYTLEESSRAVGRARLFSRQKEPDDGVFLRGESIIARHDGQELIRTRNGVRWYNDSIASSPSRTIAGLNSFKERVILIAGGKDKGIAYDSLGPVINDHVKLLILCGATAGVIRQSVKQAANYDGLEIVDVADYHAAVALADNRAKEGDVVILSPASTSFDRFANFMERGRVFKDIVNSLK